MKTQTGTLNNRLLIAALLALSAVILNTISIKADELRKLQERSFPTQAGKNLYVDASSGDVFITTWDKQEVYVKISGNKNAESKLKFKFENTSDGVKISAKRDSWVQWIFWSNVNVKFEVKVPANYNSYVNTAGGNINLSGLNGSTKLETSGGDLTINNTNGKIILSTSGGDIKLENSNGEFNVSTSGGDISINNFSGNLKASTSGGDIRLDGRSGEVHASTSGGDIYLNYKDMNQGIYLESTGGDIIVRVPANFSAYADLSTTGGDVTCDLPITSSGKMTASRIKGNLNGGGKPLHCSSTGGDIKITK